MFGQVTVAFGMRVQASGVVLCFRTVHLVTTLISINKPGPLPNEQAHILWVAVPTPSASCGWLYLPQAQPVGGCTNPKRILRVAAPTPHTCGT